MASLKDLDSWKTLHNAAVIRNHEGILDIAKTLKEGEVPQISYHRKCRSIFTLKRDLQKLAQSDNKVEEQDDTSSRRSSGRQPANTQSRVYERICVFCEKAKYLKGIKTREALIQCVDLRADNTVRRAAMSKNDSRILAIVSRELVAAEACYHKSCYRDYTRNVPGPLNIRETKEEVCDEYIRAETHAYEMLFNHIRTNLLQNPRVVRMSELYTLFTSFFKSQDIEIKESTRTHFRRKLEGEFGDMLEFEDLFGNKRVFVIPRGLSRLHLAKLAVENSNISKPFKGTEEISKTALHLRKAIQEQEIIESWPPKPCELTENAVIIPDVLKEFLYTLLTGSTEFPGLQSCSPKIQRLITSFGQDLVFGTSGGRQKPPKHVLLPYAVKSLSNNVELIQIINRCGHGIAYSQLEEINTALCLQKLAATSCNEVPLPENIRPFISTTLAWDNIDRLEETLSGEGTSHRVNGIAVQANHFGPHPPSASLPVIMKSKKRSIESVGDEAIPIYNVGERCGPHSRGYVEVKLNEIMECAWKKNLLWVLARIHASEKQSVPSWTGFNILVRNDQEVTKDNVGYLPTINAPATNMSTVYQILLKSLQIKETLKLHSMVVVFDQALYAKAAEIKWKHRAQFNDLVLRMGVFHTICTFLSVIGKRFQDAGLRDVIIESGVIAEGSTSGVLEGRAYNRAIRFHKLMFEALNRLAWIGFISWVEEHHKEKKPLVDEFFKGLKTLCDRTCEREFNATITSPSFQEVSQLFSMYMHYLRHGNGKLSKFWMSYVDMVEILLELLRASREGDWELHLSSISEIVPWCFAYDKPNYARYLSAYLHEMSHLPEEHPDTLEYLRSGGFSVQIGEDNPFGRIPVDQTCEETVNKDTQTSGGTKGFSLKPNAVSKFYLVAEYRSTFLRQLKDMLHISPSSSQHNDLQPSRIARDEADVKSIVSILQDTWLNPFNPDLQDLVCLSTGKVATPDVERDLLGAKDIGEEAYKAFREQRLQCNTPKVKFHDAITKAKLMTFTHLTKKVTIKAGKNQEVILKADRRLFAQMIVIAESRNLQMRDVLSHPLGPLPWSLATPDGLLRKTNKASLAKELQKNVQASDAIPHPSACVIDGMALVQRLKGDQKTFAAVAEALLGRVLNEGGTSDRIDVVFDDYREESIKNAERINRGEGSGSEYRNIQADHKVKQWRRFLCSSKNKQALIVFVTSEWKKDKYKEKLLGKTLVITCGDKCYQLSSGMVQPISELESTQEEADTRVILHAVHAARSRFASVVVVSEDTDVLILLLAFKSSISSSLFIKCGSQTRVKYIDVSRVVESIGANICRSLPGFHAFTGCDTVSAFAGRGKVSGYRIVSRSAEFQGIFQQLGTEWDLSDHLYCSLEKFTCSVYCSNPGTSDINELRYRLFCLKRGDVESNQLPPCRDMLRKHSQRANYQAAVWKRCLERCPVIPPPEGAGWCTEDEKLVVDWMGGQPAPQAVLELLSCQCSRACKPPSCSCIANGLKCTDMCRLQECTNRSDEDNDVVPAGDDDDDDDDEER